MIRSKKTDIICILSILLAFVIAIIAYTSEKSHHVAVMTPMSRLQSKISTEYETKLFDSSYVHEIDIIISDINWDYMTKNAVDEQYVNCDLKIDEETISNVSIRPKGNSSLGTISNMGSTQFSFKIEFDQNNPEQTYHGLDKLALNNLGQDPSCMKDFMTYHLMQEMNTPSPCSAYTLVKLNGEDFGLYLAVEAIEDSFCYRNYGEDYGNIYKPDNFSMESLNLGGMLDYSTPDSPLAVAERIMTGEEYKDLQEGERTDILYDAVYPIFSEIKPLLNLATMNYAGDNPESYHTIFDTSVFDITSGDKKSYIDAVRNLNESDDPLSALDTDKLLRYFAVHHFVNNYDSYDSMFVHNFYVRENDGKLSLIPWDYNLAFGTFNYQSVVGSIMGENSRFDFIPNTADAMSPEKSMINYPIDTPCYSVDISERPLLYYLMNNLETLAIYHQYLDELISECFENGKYDEMYSHTYEIIRPYVEKGLTFYTVEKFDAGAETIHDYMNLRTESIREQLDGNIPSTADGQKENPHNLIDTGNLNLARLVDFDSILAGISQENIMNILDILLEDNFEYNTDGAVEAMHYYAENTDKLTEKIPDIIKIPFVKKMITDKISPFIEFIVAVIVLLVALIFVRKYHRRKIYAVKT